MLDPQLSQDEQFWAQWIDATARRPSAWLDTARMLKRAADTLAPIYQGEMHDTFLHGQYVELESPPGLAPVYLMLAGYAIENLAKGLIAARHPNTAPPSRHLDERLVSQAGVGLVDEEPDLVRRLRLFLDSFGRYPVPLPNTAQKLVHGSIVTAPMRYSTNDANLVEALYARMYDTLEQAVARSTV